MVVRTVRRCSLVAVMLTLGAVAARADVLPSGSVHMTPARAGAPSTLVVHASFDQPAGAHLLTYNLDFARGLRFDLRAVAGRCTLAQARSAHCPANSRFVAGTARVSVGTASGTSLQSGSTYTIYLMAPPRRGDLAGVALIAQRGGFAISLVGPLVRLPRGPYATEIQFRNIASELPPGLVVQIRRVDARFGTQRTVMVRHGRVRERVTYHLFTNPDTCTRRGWPLRITWGMSTGIEHYVGTARCLPAK